MSPSSHRKDATPNGAGVPQIEAAGAVLVRGQGTKRAVALIHRPSYMDWSLPKGKREPGEKLPVTAVREVEEETGITIRLGVPLDSLHYVIPKGPKIVHWWVGRELRSSKRKPDDEVDDVQWVLADEALERLTYSDERVTVQSALAAPETTPLIIVRHAKAVKRSDFKGSDDRRRPLDEAGRDYARRVLPRLFDAYGIRQVKSSSSVRCTQTLAPFARNQGLTVKPMSLLSEEVGGPHLAGVERYMRKLAVAVGRKEVPTVVCGHRPVLPAMLSGLGIEPQAMHVGQACIVHIGTDGRPVTHEWR